MHIPVPKDILDSFNSKFAQVGKSVCAYEEFEQKRWENVQHDLIAVRPQHQVFKLKADLPEDATAEHPLVRDLFTSLLTQINEGIGAQANEAVSIIWRIEPEAHARGAYARLSWIKVSQP